ncbi:MAG: hypothetical protein Q9M37_00045 [Desulfonauticus sp.]|nr:hypothetical protein [Desulfonauticus sp.]
MGNNNIDALINEISFEIVKEKIVDKNQIDKMLGVLANDGVYAWWVYTKKELNWKFVSDESKFKEFELIRLILLLNRFDFLFREILSEQDINKISQLQEQINNKQNEKKSKKDKNKEIDKEIANLKGQQNDLLNNFFVDLSQNLQNLLFFREILEKILIYARYHAKAMGE